MSQFILSVGIILSVGAVLILNGLVDNVKEVNSLSNNSSIEADAQPSEDTLMVPADLGSLFEKESPAANEAAVLPAELEYVFDAKYKEDGYIVEIYREFEMYRDANGNVLKEVPTSNFEYIKYKE